MRHLLVLGLALAVLTQTGVAQDRQPRVKHFQDGTKSAKSAVVGKAPASTTADANLHRLEQQQSKSSAPRVKRTPVKGSSLKPEREKPTPPINFSGASNRVKGPATTNQGTNPYRARLRQKGSHH